MKLKLKILLNSLLDSTILYLLMSISEKTFDLTKWSDAMTEMLAAYVLFILVANLMLKFKI